MDPVGAVLSIVSIVDILQRAYDLRNDCLSAPDEIRLAADHVSSMTLVLEGVKSDLIGNRNSYVHQKTDVAKARTQNLKFHVGSCEHALRKMEKLVGKYKGFKNQQQSFWDRFRWSTNGKREIADAKSDVVLTTSQLDMFMHTQGLSVLWKIESSVEELKKGFKVLEGLVPSQPTPTPSGGRPRANSIITRTLVASLFLTRLKKTLKNYRRKKYISQRYGNATTNAGPRRPRTITRINSGFAPNKDRDLLITAYANNIAADSTNANWSMTKFERPRTPSPDFYYVASQGRSESPTPGLFRRASSMQRLTAHINARSAAIPKQSRDYYACYKVGVAHLAIGPKTVPQVIRHRRGQLQLQKMAAVWKEADEVITKQAVTDRDKRVRFLLKDLNGKEQKKRSGKWWQLVCGRVVARDPGRTGMVMVEKALIIVVRR